jgi:predicted aspartyl protease
MNDTGAVPGPENDLPAVRVFRLLGGKEYVIFFAAHEDELPGENVGRELEALVNRNRGVATRGALGVVSADIISGVIGTAAWVTVSRALVATTSYLRRRKSRAEPAEKATVVMRLGKAGAEIGLETVGTLREASIGSLEDGRWVTEFSYEGGSVRAEVDPGATVVKWTLG